MKLIVGLGNPGKEYEGTRHNLGFMVVEQFLKNFESASKTSWNWDKYLKSDIAELEWHSKKAGKTEKVILVKPKTYMNNSGMALKLITNRYPELIVQTGVGKIQAKTNDIWVVHDDIDLPLGSMKIRLGGSSAGHKGVLSIITDLKSDEFWRFRMGISKGHSSEFVIIDGKRVRHKIKTKDVEDFVLGKFKPQDRGKLKEEIKRGAKAIEMALEEGLEMAMNRFNTK